MNTNAKPTPGPWEAVSYISVGSGRRIWNVQTKAREDFGTFLTQADAILFAEALNVRQECGLTPRQLADQRSELLAALTKIACYDDLSAWKQQRAHKSYSHFDEPGSVQIAHEAIARAKVQP